MLGEILKLVEMGGVYSTCQLAESMGKDEAFIKAGLLYLEEKNYIKSVHLEGMEHCKSCMKSCKRCSRTGKKRGCPVLWEAVGYSR